MKHPRFPCGLGRILPWLVLVVGLASPARAQDAGLPPDDADAPLITVFAMVGDLRTGEPIVGAFVRINGELVSITDDAGRFQVVLVPGRHRIDVRRVGYEARSAEFHLSEDKPVIELGVALDPIAYQLPAIVVRGESTRLVFGTHRAFYQRVASGTGHYILRDEIERRSPRTISDLLRNVPGLEVNQVGIEAAQVRVFPRRQLCEEPLVFLDGIEIHTTSVDLIADPAQLEGMEIYTRPLNVPQEFARQGSICGVIAVWTR